MTEWLQYSEAGDWRVTPLPGVQLEKTSAHVFCRMDDVRPVFSSAILGGGYNRADQFLNLKVDANKTDYDTTPRQFLQQYCQQHHWDGTTVGMMTAASMNSLRYGVVRAEGAELLLMTTSGLSNARTAGDRAEIAVCQQPTTEAGTINIAVVSASRFSDAALMELMMMATEAKCVALQEANIISPVSGNLATGTGTDAIAVFNGVELSGGEIQYCGKHTRLGEHFARCLIELLTDSFAKDQLLKKHS